MAEIEFDSGVSSLRFYTVSGVLAIVLAPCGSAEHLRKRNNLCAGAATNASVAPTDVGSGNTVERSVARGDGFRIS